jgi:hypothetical protein
MADWNTPTLSTAYATWHSQVLARDVDGLTLQVAAATNVPTGAFRYDRANNKFQEWNGSAYVDKVLAVAGGGTGSNTPAGIRGVLGLGDMALQNSNAVSITGGTLAGNGAGLTNLNALNIATGTVNQARLGGGTANSTTYLRGDQVWAVLNTYIVPSIGQGSPFGAVGEAYYPLYNAGNYVVLPLASANHGKRVILVNRTGHAWTVYAQSPDLILGATSWQFDYGIYSSVTLTADANYNVWDVL